MRRVVVTGLGALTPIGVGAEAYHKAQLAGKSGVRPITRFDASALPVRIAAGHRAVTELRWIAGPVFPRSRALRAAAITVRIGSRTLTAPLAATLYGEAGRPATFEQTPLRAAEGMAAG